MDEKITIYIYRRDISSEMMNKFSEIFYNMENFEKIYNIKIDYNERERIGLRL